MGKVWTVFSFSVLLLPLYVLGAEQPFVISTKFGGVKGVENQGVRLFPHIAYALPPIGARRWKPVAVRPQHMQLNKAVACPQDRGDGVPGEMPPTQEDCLYLNVWAPSAAGTAPVVLFVHGGAGVAGSGLKDFYDGSLFARNGIVFVSINYRLGALGMLSATDGYSPAISDILTALEWTRTRIADFGGDPGRIAVMGHSMGASMVQSIFEGGLNGVATKAILFGRGTVSDLQYETGNKRRDSGLVPTLKDAGLKDLLEVRERLRLFPYFPKKTEKPWRGSSLFLSVVAGERINWREVIGAKEFPLTFYCPLVYAMNNPYVSKQSYFYLLQTGVQMHGSELVALFRQDTFGKRFLRHLIAFTKGEPPPRSFLQLVSDWLTKEPRVLHLYPRFEVYRSFVAASEKCMFRRI